jgi:formate dehydrogenase subunit delta
MEAQKLVKMSNEIARFFEGEPERAAVLEGIASHLRRFWDPRMRRELVAHLDGGGEGMRDSVVEAVRVNRERLLEGTR